MSDGKVQCQLSEQMESDGGLVNGKRCDRNMMFALPGVAEESPSKVPGGRLLHFTLISRNDFSRENLLLDLFLCRGREMTCHEVAIVETFVSY